MKKLAFTIILLPLVATVTRAQVFGLYAKNITVSKPKAGSGDPILHKEAGPFYLIYSHDYCKFYMPVGGWVSFPALHFKTDIMGDGTIMESFISDETETTPYGRYSVMIFKSKQGYTFEIAMPQSLTLMGENAEAYSENGRVPNAPYISNWKELKAQFDKQDSLKKIAEAEKRKIDSNVNIKLNPQLRTCRALTDVDIIDYINSRVQWTDKQKKAGDVGSFNIYFTIDTTGKITRSGYNWGTSHFNYAIAGDRQVSDLPSWEQSVVEIFKTVPGWQIARDAKGVKVPCDGYLTVYLKAK